MDGSEKGQDAELLRLYAVQWRNLLFFTQVFSWEWVDIYAGRLWSFMTENQLLSALGAGRDLSFQYEELCIWEMDFYWGFRISTRA